ncbi:MAG: type VI secretion system-associated protein TagF [Xanthomonadales bacterium]|nr:type VI secretion system-associated protein TagF [Xanthomonadales bacterium]
MTESQTGTGFYGKVPVLGDFIDRRLSKVFIEYLDEWLQGGMAHSRESLGEGWLNQYLTSPVWRFSLSPGICDQQSWLGVMIPSVDKVGRYFPLLVAIPHRLAVPPVHSFQVFGTWFDKAAALALTSLEDGFQVTEFDSALASLELPVAAASGQRRQPGGIDPVAETGWRYEVGDLDCLPDLYPYLIQDLIGELYPAHSTWWAGGSQSMGPSLLICQGLPSQRSFTALVSGNWVDSGLRDLGFSFPGQPGESTQHSE